MRGTPGDLSVKTNLFLHSGSAVLIQVNPIYKKGIKFVLKKEKKIVHSSPHFSL